MTGVVVLIALAAMGVSLAILLTAHGRSLRKLFSAEHFVELAQLLSTHKSSFTEGAGSETSTLPPNFATSRGLLVLYSVSPFEDKFVHHCSVSIQNTSAFAAGGTFAVFILRTLGLDPTRAKFAHTGVTHAGLLLTAEEQLAFTTRDVDVPGLGSAQHIHKECMEVRTKVATSGSLLRSEEQLLAELKAGLTE